MIELDMNDTDHLVEIVTKLKRSGANCNVRMVGGYKWVVEIL